MCDKFITKLQSLSGFFKSYCAKNRESAEIARFCVCEIRRCVILLSAVWLCAGIYGCFCIFFQFFAQIIAKIHKINIWVNVMNLARNIVKC